MIGDAFVFDGVAHPFNFDPKNVLGDAGTMFANHIYAFHATLTPDGKTVMAAGKIASCMECHESKKDRLFGVKSCASAE